MERMKQRTSRDRVPMTHEQLEAFYTTEYPRLVKILALLGATIEEAEDAAQKAMADFARRSKTAGAPDHPASYVRRAAVRFFTKERQHDRERRLREARGSHPVLKAHLDDRLTVLEDEQYIEYLLGCLTSTQRKVIRLVMDGLSTPEIAQKLAKSSDNVRQHLKNGRDRLKLHPEITPLIPGQRQRPGQHGTGPTVIAPEPRKEEV